MPALPSNHPELLVPLYSSGFGKGLDKDNVQPESNAFRKHSRKKKENGKASAFLTNCWSSLMVFGSAPFDCHWLTNALSHTLKPEHACKKLLGNFKRPEGSGLSLWTHPNSWNHFLERPHRHLRGLSSCGRPDACADQVARRSRRGRRC